MKTKVSAYRILWGIVLIGFAALIFCKYALGWTDFNIFFKGWWTLFIIVPSIASMFHGGPRSWNICLTAFGVWLFMMRQDFIGKDLFTAIFGSLVVLVLGLWLIFGAFFRKNRMPEIEPFSYAEGTVGGESQEYVNSSAAFSSSKTKSTSNDFQGGKIEVAFGSRVVDLQDAALQRDAQLNVSAVFGSIKIIAPRKVHIRVFETPVFGSVKNTVPVVAEENVPTLTIKASAVFGSIVIGTV